jgi:hypothetical protein
LSSAALAENADVATYHSSIIVEFIGERTLST